jgi:hypothetical protein
MRPRDQREVDLVTVARCSAALVITSQVAAVSATVIAKITTAAATITRLCATTHRQSRPPGVHRLHHPHRQQSGLQMETEVEMEVDPVTVARCSAAVVVTSKVAAVSATAVAKNTTAAATITRQRATTHRQCRPPGVHRLHQPHRQQSGLQEKQKLARRRCIDRRTAG